MSSLSPVHALIFLCLFPTFRQDDDRNAGSIRLSYCTRHTRLFDVRYDGAVAVMRAPGPSKYLIITNTQGFNDKHLGDLKMS